MTDPLAIATRMAWRERGLGQLLIARETLIGRCGAAEDSEVVGRIHYAIAALLEDQFADCRKEGARLGELYDQAEEGDAVSGNPWSDGTTYLLITLASGDASLDTREARRAAANAVSE